nr:Ig-like domain-containing protein [Pseudovibrio denitrificans]
MQGTTAIFSATLNSASGAYSVTQHAPLNHSQSVDQFQLRYIAADSDGDAATGTLQISISDSVPVASSAPESISLSETDLFEARMNGDASISQSGTLNVQWGADVGSTKALSFSSSMSGTPAPFAVNGAQVFYSLSGIGNELVAKTQDGTLVFKVTLDSGNTGSYTVEFFTPIDHAAPSEISMVFDIVATDGDGDTLPLSFSFDIADGKSIAVADQFTGKEDTPLVLDLLGNDILNSEGYSVHIVLAPAKGHLTQNADNTFNYTGHPNANGSDSFSYYIQDADGERSETVTVSIELSPENDAPIFSGVGQDTPFHLTVEDNGPQDVFTANASDADGDSLHFFLQGPDAAHFNIDAQTGKVSWKNDISYDVPADQDGDNIYDVTIVARDPSGAEASQDYQIQVTEGHNTPPPPPTVYLHTREAGSYQVSWDFDFDNYTSNISDDIRSDAWKEYGDDGLAAASNDGSSDIYIDEATGGLVLTDQSSASANGDDNLASLSKTFDLTGAQSAQLSLSYTANFSSSETSKLFYIEVMMADGSVQRIAEITDTEDHSQSRTINLDLSDHISSATTIRLVAPGDLTSADTLRISDLTVSIEQLAPLEEQHLDATYQIDGEDLAVAKSAKIDGLQEPITGLTVKLFNAQNGDVLNYTAIDGINGELQDSDNGVLTLNFSGNLNASIYQNLINSLTFSTNSDSLEARSLSVILHTESGSSSPSISTIHMLPNVDGETGSDKNPVDGTSADDTLRGTEGDDAINGFEGSDHLYAGEGQDTLTGGEGSDIYFFEQLDGAADHIADYKANSQNGTDRDIIDISKLLKDYGEGGLDQYRFFTDQYVRLVKDPNGQYTLQVDLDAYDNDHSWETLTTLEIQNADVPGASVSIDVFSVATEFEIPIENAFPIT